MCINQISKTVIQLIQKGGTMNREMDGQLTIRDETESTSIAVAGPDQVVTLPMDSVLADSNKSATQWEDKCGFWKKLWSCFFQAVRCNSFDQQKLFKS